MPDLLISKVPYTLYQGRYRPYLEIVLFYNNKLSTKTLGLVDSGADHTIIPYSIGYDIGLPLPKSDNELLGGNGVGGQINYVERDCRVYIPDYNSNSIYGFNETVWWVYPNIDIRNRQDELIREYKDLTDLQKQCIPNTNLDSHFKVKMNETLGQLKLVNNMCETDVLLGRNFFNNFHYIQFFQRDINQEKTCSFHFHINKKKIISTIPLTA